MIKFTLPSNPEVEISLREATVADAIQFSNLDPECEEEAATDFLNTLQNTPTPYDSSLWTGEDRRYALFYYYVNTTDNKMTPLSYTCSICGKKHVRDIENSRISATFTPIKGKPSRDFPFNGHNVIVTPLKGADLQNLEKQRMHLLRMENTLENGISTMNAEQIKTLEAQIRYKRNAMAMLRLICCIDMPYLNESGTKTGRQLQVGEVLKAMPISEFKDFMGRVEECLKDMRHGLRTSYQKRTHYAGNSRRQMRRASGSGGSASILPLSVWLGHSYPLIMRFNGIWLSPIYA